MKLSKCWALLNMDLLLLIKICITALAISFTKLIPLKISPIHFFVTTLRSFPRSEPRTGFPSAAGTQQHVLVGILAEDVPNDHDGLLHHVVDLGLDEVQQRAHAALRRLLRGEDGGTEEPVSGVRLRLRLL